MSNRAKFLMEESNYVHSSLPPALVVFSQSGYGDPIRIQRPFSSQVSDGKDSLGLQNLSPSSFGLRPMDAFGGLAPSQLVHLQNPFLHPVLEGRLPFGSAGAFRPIVTSSTSNSCNNSTSVSLNLSVEHSNHISSTSNSCVPPGSSTSNSTNNLKNHPSAFTPPNQSSRRKLESIVENVMDCRNREHHHTDKNSNSTCSNGSQGRHKSVSPSVTTNSSPHNRHEDHHEDEGDETGSRHSDLTDRSTPEEPHHSKRKRKGGHNGDSINCPVCKVSLRSIEIESHLLSEVEQLMCMSRLRRAQRCSSSEPSTSGSNVDSNNRKDNLSGGELSQDSRWDTYHRVRANRLSRLRIKTRRRRDDSGGGNGIGVGSHLSSCPVCQVPLHGTNEQSSSHVEACLRKNGDILDEDEPVDIEGDDDTYEMEEYGRFRRPHIHHRTSPDSYSTAINMTTHHNSGRSRGGGTDDDNDNLEVVVDGDENDSNMMM